MSRVRKKTGKSTMPVMASDVTPGIKWDGDVKTAAITIPLPAVLNLCPTALTTPTVIHMAATSPALLNCTTAALKHWN